MQLQISFRKRNGGGIGRIFILPNELLKFHKGRARRTPSNKQAVFNSVPIKYITSIKLVDKFGMKCSKCDGSKERLICEDCISELLKTPLQSSTIPALDKDI